MPAPRAYLRVRNPARNTVLAGKVIVADTSLTRFIGLLSRRDLPAGEGLLIRPSNGVHTLGMRFSIDVLLLDRSDIVLAAYKVLRPFRVTRLNWRAAAALELPAGTISSSRTAIGDRLEFSPVDPTSALSE